MPVAKKSQKVSKKVAKKSETIGGEFLVHGGPDAEGAGWYVEIAKLSVGSNTWLYPAEARKLAAALIRFAKKPRAAA